MAMPAIKLNDLRQFIAVCEQGGFSRAALVVGRVQSNVTGRVQALERQLGTPLFERMPRRAVPTRSGERLYRSAKLALEILDDAVRAIRRARTNR